MTETKQHPVDLALRAITTTLEPRTADFEYSKAKLTDAMSLPFGGRPQTRRRLSWVTATALVAVLAVFVLQTISVSAARAVLGDLAQVVELTDAMVIPDDQFAYTIVEASVFATDETMTYILPYTREQWSGDQETVRVQDTNHQPQFFTSADEKSYYAAGLDEGDRLEEPVVNTQEDSNAILDEQGWSTDPRQLEAMIRGQEGDDEIAVLDQCLDFLRAPLLPPELRAAVLQVIAGLDLELVEESDDGGGTFALEYLLQESGPRRVVFTLDSSGYLIFEESILIDGYPDLGVPPGTAENRAVYTVPLLVDSLERP